MNVLFLVYVVLLVNDNGGVLRMNVLFLVNVIWVLCVHGAL